MKPAASPTAPPFTPEIGLVSRSSQQENANVVSVDGGAVSGAVANGRASVHALAQRETKSRISLLFLFALKEDDGGNTTWGSGRKYPERTATIPARGGNTISPRVAMSD